MATTTTSNNSNVFGVLGNLINKFTAWGDEILVNTKPYTKWIIGIFILFAAGKVLKINANIGK